MVIHYRFCGILLSSAFNELERFMSIVLTTLQKIHFGVLFPHHTDHNMIL